MAAKQGFRIKSLLPPIVVVAALGWLSTVEVELPQIFVEEQIIELRDRFYDIAVPSDQVVWAVGKNGKVVRSDDRGETFYVQTVPTANHLQSIAVWDADHAVIIANGGVTLNTADGGTSWNLVEAPMGEVAKKMFRTEIAPDGRVWATAEFGVILYSDDQGKTWTLVGGDQDVAWNDIGFADNGRVCVAGEFGQLTCSDDQGLTWISKQTPLDSSMMGLAFSDGIHGLAVGVGGRVIRTDDAGETWTQVNSPTTKHMYGLVWATDHWVIVGEKGAFLEYRPATDTWVEENLGSKGNVWYSGVQSGHGGVYISGQKLGIWKEGGLHLFGRVN